MNTFVKCSTSLGAKANHIQDPLYMWSQTHNINCNRTNNYFPASTFNMMDKNPTTHWLQMHGAWLTANTELEQSLHWSACHHMKQSQEWQVMQDIRQNNVPTLEQMCTFLPYYIFIMILRVLYFHVPCINTYMFWHCMKVLCIDSHVCSLYLKCLRYRVCTRLSSPYGSK